MVINPRDRDKHAKRKTGPAPPDQPLLIKPNPLLTGYLHLTPPGPYPTMGQQISCLKRTLMSFSLILDPQASPRAGCLSFPPGWLSLPRSGMDGPGPLGLLRSPRLIKLNSLLTGNLHLTPAGPYLTMGERQWCLKCALLGLRLIVAPSRRPPLPLPAGLDGTGHQPPGVYGPP